MKAGAQDPEAGPAPGGCKASPAHSLRVGKQQTRWFLGSAPASPGGWGTLHSGMPWDLVAAAWQVAAWGPLDVPCHREVLGFLLPVPPSPPLGRRQSHSSATDTTSAELCCSPPVCLEARDPLWVGLQGSLTDQQGRGQPLSTPRGLLPLRTAVRVLKPWRSLPPLQTCLDRELSPALSCWALIQRHVDPRPISAGNEWPGLLEHPAPGHAALILQSP